MTPSNISDHFALAEVTHSNIAERFGIDNSFPTELLPVVAKTAMGMEKVRAALGNKAISIDSWYRCLELNTKLGSKPSSQHLKGEAVDFICPAFGSPVEICRALIVSQLLIRFDQLIFEHTWVHISWNSNPSGVQKGQVLSLLATGGYAIGLTDSKGNKL